MADSVVAIRDWYGNLKYLKSTGAGTEADPIIVTVGASVDFGDITIDSVGISSIAAGDNNIGNVDIASALPAGTNAIGKLAANSGVDIGDVDVLSLPSLPAGTNAIGKLAANSGVDIGDVDVTSLPALPAGDNNIGNVDIASAIPAGTNVIGKVSIDQTTPGTTNLVSIGTNGTVTLGAGTAAIGKLAANSGVDIGDVDVLSLPALAAGTNAIGKLAANSGVDIGDVDILSIAAGTNVIGKVTIDQTTPGTTNKVSLGTDSVNTVSKVSPTTLATHRTFTAYAGESGLAPAADNALWEENPGGYNTARVYVDVVVTDVTETQVAQFAEQSIWLRNGTVVFPAAETIAAITVPYANYLYQGAYCQKTVNDGAAYTDYELSGNASEVVLDALDTKANGDWFIVGAYKPFVSVYLAPDPANAEIATLAAEYWDGDSWTAITFTDNTASAGATLAVADQCLLFTSLPGDWAASTINSIAAYWVRFSVSAALSAAVTLTEVGCYFPIQCMKDVVIGGDDLLVGFKNTGELITGTYKVAWR